MATKPTIALARWADQIGANLVSPSSGLRDLGFQPGTAAVSGIVNTELNELYKWALYLSDGALSGNHTIAGTLATAEALTVGGQPLVFADFTYTADAGTDTLTATAHGRETGDGAARTTNSGGGLPGGLAINTDYFVIRTGANTFKLATSRANALAGIAIDITSNGTGTHTLIDQPGTTRVSDAIVTRNLQVDGDVTVVGKLKQGLDTYHVPPIPFLSGAWVETLTGSPLGLSLRSNASGSTYVWIPTITGLTITSLTFAIRSEAGTEDLTNAIVRRMFKDATAADSIGSTGVLNNISTTWSDVTIDVTDTLMDDTFDLALFIDGNAAGLHIKAIRAVMGVV